MFAEKKVLTGVVKQEKNNINCNITQAKYHNLSDANVISFLNLNNSVVYVSM